MARRSSRRDVGSIDTMQNCSKAGYRTKSEAKRALRRVQSIRDNGRKIIRPYHCGNCGDWHLTSEPKRRVEVPNRYSAHLPEKPIPYFPAR